MSRKKKRMSSEEEVQLNLAAMLDMAFQLLAFFILTFRPPPVEGQIALEMPKPQPLANANAKEHAGDEEKNKNPVIGFNTLDIALNADKDGKLDTILVGKEGVGADPALRDFNQLLKNKLNDPATPFDQVVISVPASLHYADLLRVMGVCSKQTIGGDPNNRLKKLSVVDADTSGK